MKSWKCPALRDRNNICNTFPFLSKINANLKYFSIKTQTFISNIVYDIKISIYLDSYLRCVLEYMKHLLININITYEMYLLELILNKKIHLDAQKKYLHIYIIVI